MDYDEVRIKKGYMTHYGADVYINGDIVGSNLIVVEQISGRGYLKGRQGDIPRIVLYGIDDRKKELTKLLNKERIVKIKIKCGRGERSMMTDKGEFEFKTLDVKIEDSFIFINEDVYAGCYREDRIKKIVCGEEESDFTEEHMINITQY